jgi:hypothetical protein
MPTLDAFEQEFERLSVPNGRNGLGQPGGSLEWMICRAAQATSDQGRACSEALVDSGGGIRRLRIFGKWPK